MTETNYSSCQGCGKKKDSSPSSTPLCVECLRMVDLAVAQQTIDLWLAGHTTEEISQMTGRSKGAIRIGFNRMRKQGFPIPRRAQGKFADGETHWIDPVPEKIELPLGWASGVHSA